MASWQTHAVCVYLRDHPQEALPHDRGRAAQHGERPPRGSRCPTSCAAARRWRRSPVARWSRCGRADGVVAGTGRARLPARRRVRQRHPAAALVAGRATSPTRTHREVHVARYPLAPAADVTDAEAFLAALHDRLAPSGPLHVLGDSAGGTLSLLLAQAPRRRRHHRRADPHRAVARPVDDQPGRSTAVERARPLAHPRGHAADRGPLGGRARPHRPHGEPAVRRPEPAAAHAGARRVARHLPTRLRPAARAGAGHRRPDPARRGRLAARLPAAAHARGPRGRATRSPSTCCARSSRPELSRGRRTGARSARPCPRSRATRPRRRRRPTRRR